METTTQNYLQTAAKSAAYIALTMIGMQILIFILSPKGIAFGMLISLLSFILYISGMVIYGKKFRALQLDGKISYSKMFVFLLTVVGFYTLIMLVYGLFHFKILDPNYAQKAMVKADEIFNQLKIPYADKEKAMEKIRLGSSFVQTILSLVYSNLGLGVLVSLVVSAVLYKKDNGMDSFMKELE